MLVLCAGICVRDNASSSHPAKAAEPEGMSGEQMAEICPRKKGLGSRWQRALLTGEARWGDGDPNLPTFSMMYVSDDDVDWVPCSPQMIESGFEGAQHMADGTSCFDGVREAGQAGKRAQRGQRTTNPC